MTDYFGRIVGVSIVGLGLLALVISAPAGDQPYAAAVSRADERLAETSKPEGPADLGDRSASQLRGQTGDRMPQAAGSPEAALERWADASRNAAQAVIEKYGQPDEVSEGQLLWHNTGAFRKTVVYREALPHNFPVPHSDVIEQFVEYRVPAEKLADLSRFDGSLRADRTAGLLSARGESELSNFIALNLAHEIIVGRRSMTASRQAFAKIFALSMTGKVSPYTQGLLFKPRGHGQPDPDAAVLKATPLSR